MNKIVERVEREAGLPGLASILAERLTPTDLQSLLLEVYRQRSSKLTPAMVLSNYRANRFVRPSEISPTKLMKWEQVAFSQLPPEFEPVTLAPVCPLGSSSVVAGVDPNWSVAAARNVKIVSDSTNVLALECASRRQELLRADPKSIEAVHLAASHRLLRAQYFTGPHQVTHFSLFALCSAGKTLQFELSTLRLHICFYLKALRAYIGDGAVLSLSVTDFSPVARIDMIGAQLLAPVRAEFEQVECNVDDQRTSGKGYYPGLCFHIHATTSIGERLELADGGCVDWTQKYLSNAKERLVISGLGSERLCQDFGEMRSNL